MTYNEIYEAVYDTYYPDSMWERMLNAGEPTSLNLAEEALGRHGESDRVGLRIRDFESGESEQYTFRELNEHANQAANFLEAQMEEGERIGLYLEPSIELYATLFGSVKSLRLFIPLDVKFGPDALSYRLDDADATAVLTTPDQINTIEPTDIPSLEFVLVVGETDVDLDGVEVISYDAVSEHSSEYTAIRTGPLEPYAVSYSSGTTGQPSQQTSTHATAAGIDSYLNFVVDLQPEDVYFCAASPAWSYGLTVGTLCPGLKGTAIGAYRGRFDLERYLDTLDMWDVTNAMVAPTALRQLQAADIDIDQYDINLRVLVTAGETLDAKTAEWCDENLGTMPLDAYGLSEGGMLLCNYPFPDWEIKPGSMGKPLPGYDVGLLDDDGNVISEPNTVGEISVYSTDENPEGEWTRMGDLAEFDADGYYWYRGRADQVIISAGYRIGPDEVQDTLIRHEAVEEAGVIGVDHNTRGEIVKAFITLAPGYDPSDQLKEEITAFARQELSKHEYPREIQFVDELPKTASDKIKRVALEELHEQEAGAD